MGSLLLPGVASSRALHWISLLESDRKAPGACPWIVLWYTAASREAILWYTVSTREGDVPLCPFPDVGAGWVASAGEAKRSLASGGGLFH